MPNTSIYLDNNATTRMDSRVVDAMTTILAGRLANPASQHKEGRRARLILEDARSVLAKSLGCRTRGMDADQVVFTSGGTEANNLAILGLLEKIEGDLVVSTIEHPSILGTAEMLSKQGKRRVRYLSVDQNGQASLESWRQILAEHREACAANRTEGKIALISLMLANNETGVLQPFEPIVESARMEKILVHADAVQAIAKIPFCFEKSNLDAITVTAHKLHGPVGIGALILKSEASITPQLFGGFQQLGLRPGTEAVALAVGFAKAMQLAAEDGLHRQDQMSMFRMELEKLLLTNQRPPTIISANVPRLPHTISLAYPGIERQALQMALDREGVFCSTGSACASGSGLPSHVLQAMQVPDWIVRSAIRLSLSFETTADEIKEAARRISLVVNRFPASNSSDMHYS